MQDASPHILQRVPWRLDMLRTALKVTNKHVNASMLMAYAYETWLADPASRKHVNWALLYVCRV